MREENQTIRQQLTIILVVVLLLITGCEAQSTPEATVQPTNTEIPATEVVYPTATPDLSITPEPTQPIFGVQSGQVVIETGLFATALTSSEALKTLPAGEELHIMGRSFGSHWFWVEDSSGDDGWLESSTVSITVPLEYLPLKTPNGCQAISGAILTDLGEPVAGVPLTEPVSGLTTQSDVFGKFAFYLPVATEGMVTIEAGTPACDSVVMDASCQPAYQLLTPSLDMLLPDAAPLVFFYEMGQEENTEVEATPQNVRIRATINVEILNLRATPTASGAVLMQLINSSAVYAIGKTPGSEWTQVIGPNELVGWLYTEYLDFDEDASDLPVVEVEGADLINGRVITSDGEGVANVRLTLYKVGAQADTETEIVTNGKGEFTAYFTSYNSGIWNIQMPVQDCEVSIYDDDCKPTKYFTLNTTAWVTLPEPSPVVFMFQEGDGIISGSVESAEGQPYINMNVIAVRDDGAFAYMTTDYSGEFALPAGPGIWEVFAYLNSLDIESTREIVTVGGISNPDPVRIIVE